MQMTDGIRSAVEAVDREVSLLAALELAAVADGSALNGLRASWGALVGLMAVGPPSELVKCPHCGRVGDSGAMHCWTCWEELVPAPPTRDDRLPEGGGT